MVRCPDIEDSDMYLMMSNLLDNAMEHIGQKKQILLEIQDQGSMLMIRITNSADADTSFSENSQKDAEHGYGLKTIKRIVEKYDGTAEFRKEEDCYIAAVLLPSA